MATVTESAEIAAIADAVVRAPLVAFDLEFVSQDRLVPTLGLVQVAWLEHVGLDAPVEAIVAAVPEIRLVDPIDGDAEPLVRALAAHPLVVAHAPRQDLGLLASRFEVALEGIVDTQLMAAFGGLGDQVGLAALASEILGVTLAKEQQWTAWTRRPLSEAQLAYAAADVQHLPALYARLAERLGPRLAWAREESARILGDALAAAAVTPETAWQQVGGVRGLDAAGQAALVAIAAWRHEVAVELDRPLGQVITDRVLVELARQRPASASALRATKGLSPLAKTRADALVAAIAAGTPAVAPRASARRSAQPGRSASARAQRWADMLVSIVQVLAHELGIAPRLLATRADAELAARTVDEGGLAAAQELPAFSTWRREVLGRWWEGWLAGRVAIVGDPDAPQGIRLVEGDYDQPTQ